ncbi:hypothetical protein J7K56_01500 [Candidatus Calescamantes bacterium]|nr:hypothetical protein [Candidatus Calescamantes bacterium]
MIEKHGGEVRLSHSFEEVWSLLKAKGPVKLATSTGKEFTAEAGITKDGRKVIRFFQAGREYARAYECCWGHYYNCNRTRFGMYAKALDAWMGESGPSVMASSQGEGRQRTQGCFIATAVFDTEQSSEVEILCRFRDTVLLRNIYGRVFVKFYYVFSPPVAQILRKNNALKKVVRKLVRIGSVICSKFVDNTNAL